jgi:HPt (histidine-containing phosphotransfer) domain-containing protein
MLETLASIASIIGGLAVLVAVIFGMVQVRQIRQQRRDSAAIELMRTLQTDRFVEAFHKLSGMPAELSAAELRAMGAEYEDAAISLVNIYETIGLLVFRRTVSFRAVCEVCGGMLAEHWNKLHTWIFDFRVEQNYERFAEWFQWLVERVRTQETAFPSEAAYRRFSSWQPRD